MRSSLLRAGLFSAPLALALSACSGSPRREAKPSGPPRPLSSVLREAQQAATKKDATGSDRTLKYAVVVLGRNAGEAVTAVHADGTRETTYAYVDNGRGPKLTARAAVTPTGTLQSFEAHGTDTMGTTIDEKFTVDGRTSRWASKAEHGEKSGAEGAFYVPLAPYPETLGLLVQAALKAGGKLALLPEGDVRVERTVDTTVSGAAGRKHLTGYVVTGLEMTPTRVWMSDDGELFGTTEAWLSFVEKGYEGEIERLVGINKGLDEKREEALALRLATKPPAAGMAFLHARVFDAESKKWKLDHMVVIAGGKITAVGPTSRAKVPAGADVIDLQGKAIVPGLWDMHAHLAPGDGELDIAAGVTTARDLGNDPDRLDAFKARFDEGKTIGPHVVRAGFVEGRGEKAAGSKITAETPDEATKAVEFFAGRGYEQIKIYNSMKSELVPILAREAHARGMRVSGHVPVHMRAEEVVRAGYDEIQHVNMLFLNFFVDKDTDTRTTLRFSLVADNAAGLDLGSKRVKDFVALLVEKKTVIDPTLTVFEHLFKAREGEMSPSYASIADRLPVQVRRSYRTGALVVPAGKDALYKQAFTRALEFVKVLHTAKVPLVCGTDALVGFTLHRELELHAMAGIPTGDVLYEATLGSARVTKKDKTTGSITPGKDADLIIVDGDPLAHMEDIRKVRTTVRGGVLYNAGLLYEAMGVKP